MCLAPVLGMACLLARGFADACVLLCGGFMRFALDVYAGGLSRMRMTTWHPTGNWLAKLQPCMGLRVC